MPRRLLNSPSTPIFLVAGTLTYSVGIIIVRLTIHPHAGRIWAPIMFGMFTLASWLVWRRDRQETVSALERENDRLREELRAIKDRRTP